MADIEIGQTFLDLKATNYQGTKRKYFIAMSRADCIGDSFACFVMNTEDYKDKYRLWCNKTKGKFLIAPGTFSFIDRYTSIMLFSPCIYKFEEMFQENIKILDIAPPTICKHIKNCIDWNNIQRKIACLIKTSFDNSSVPTLIRTMIII